MKQCCYCKTVKSLDEFNKDKSSKDGHYSACRKCVKERKRIYYSKNKDSILKKCKENYFSDVELSRKRKREYTAKHRDSECLRAKFWYSKNKDKKSEYDKKYAKRNIDKRRLASKKFRNNHPGRKRADTAYRRAWRIKATPQWSDLKAIRMFYEKCPNGYHVDHIIPLQGKNVSGLHVLNNLQYLIARENLSKSNHYSIEHNGIK